MSYQTPNYVPDSWIERPAETEHYDDPCGYLDAAKEVSQDDVDTLELPSSVGDDEDDDERSTIACSRCGKPTTFDPTYGDLCYRCCRAENE